MKRFPDWLRKSRIPGAVTFTSQSISRKNLHTVCESAKCPNLQECWSQRTATFMILGDVCTRKCGFCAIQVGKPLFVDQAEPEHVAESAAELGLKHVVVTSVARDDLKDGGAEQFARTIRAIRNRLPESTIEVLTPDFKGDFAALDIVGEAEPDIFNHNIETVRRLSPDVRSPNADYDRSLRVLGYVKETYPEIMTKSGMMVGLGESRPEVLQSFQDLRDHHCDILTVGQYLQPNADKLFIKEFISPDEFQVYEKEARSLGFCEVFCGPYVRSSYHAGEISQKVLT